MLTNESITKLQQELEGKEITIIGHDNIDVDSFISGILLSRLLSFLNIENEFCILDKVKEETAYITVKELFQIDMKEYQREEKSGRNLFLVDHYETHQEGKVIACIDHHPTTKQNDYKFKYVKNSCATAYLIYKMMQIANYPITKEEAEMVLAAMLNDTVSFRSSKTVPSEVIEAKELCEKNKIDFNRLERYGLCLNDIEKMTDEEIISSGLKLYSFKRKNDVASSHLQLEGLPEKSIIEHWINLLRIKRMKMNYAMYVFIICDVKNNKTYEYQIIFNNVECLVHDEILSRGKNIMPRIEAMILR